MRPAAGSPEAASERLVLEEPPDRHGEGAGIIRRDEQSRLLRQDGLGNASDVGRDYRLLSQQRFEQGEGEALEPGGENEDVEPGQVGATVGAPTDPVDLLMHP